MPIPAGENCGNCAYMDFVGPYHFYGREVTVDGVQIGYCRAVPPVPAQPPTSVAASYATDRKAYVLGAEWPEVKADDWCRVWQAAGTVVQVLPSTSEKEVSP